MFNAPSSIFVENHYVFGSNIAMLHLSIQILLCLKFFSTKEIDRCVLTEFFPVFDFAFSLVALLPSKQKQTRMDNFFNFL